MQDVWFGSDLTHRDVEPVLRALSLQGHGAPPLLAFGDHGAMLVMASRVFFSFFGVNDGEELAARLLTGRDPGARRLAFLCQNLAINGAPRLERLRFVIGPMSEVVTFLCRRIIAEDQTPLFVAAALGLRSATPSSTDRRVTAAAPKPADGAAAPPITSYGENVIEPAEQVMEAPKAPATGALPPENMTFPAIQATLRTRWPTNRSIRFLWQTDADMVCTQLSPPLADVVGEANAALVGRNLLHLAPQLEPTGRLASALADKATWSGIDVPWPIGDAPAAVEVALGAIPTFDREKGFEGFRGYGVIRLDRILAHPVTRLTGRSSEGPVSEPDNVVTFPGARGLSAEDQAAFNALGTELRDQVGEKPRIEPDRSHVDAQAADDISVDGRSGSLPSSKAAPQVVATQVGSAQDGAASTGSAPSVAPEPTIGRAEDVARNGLAVLDRLAVGLLVSRDNVPIFANRHLLDLTGFADEDALHAAGGLSQLFGDMPGNVSGAEAVGLRARQGNVIPVIARMQRIAWDGLPATLLTLSSVSGPATAPASVQAEFSTPAATPASFGMTTTSAVVPLPEASEVDELRAILETATDGVVVVDGDCNVLSLNRSGEALFGCDRGEVIGKPFLGLFAPHNQSLAADYFRGLKSSPTQSLLNDGREILVKAHLGGTIPVFMTLGRLSHLSSGDASSAPRFCALFRDLTPWKKVEQDLDGARRDAERASALKTEFLAKVSHEVRTPLNAIIGFAEAMAEERFGPIGNERYRDYARNIQTSGSHIASLVNDLLDLSKIEAGKMDLALEPVDVNRVVSESVALMQPQANHERVIMRLSLAPNLPQIRADERSLRQIVLNILSNSVKFNDPGGQVIVATAPTEAGCVLIRIRDTGRGMSDADIVEAMEPFQRLATVRQTTDGTGLGLPLTKALVEANGATFSIRSKVDQGTLVEVSFPPARVLSGQGTPHRNAEGNA